MEGYFLRAGRNRPLIRFEWKEHVHNLNVETAQVIGGECKFCVKNA